MKKYLIGMFIGVILGASSAVIAATSYNFPDVPFDSSAFYRDALQEMVERDVVGGYENGNFGPNDPVTRGQLVQMLSKYDESLTTYHNANNNVGLMMDIVCAKIVVDADLDGSELFSDFLALCKSRGESAGN